MKRIISERFVTYAANEKWPSTARITIKMCDAIDQAVMQEALAATQQRYPYFCVRFRITNGDMEPISTMYFERSPTSTAAVPCRLRPSKGLTAV